MRATVRRGSAADIPEILRLGDAFMGETAYGGHGAIDPEYVANVLRPLLEPEGPGVAVLAEDGERVIGVLLAAVYPRFLDGAVVASDMMWFVEPESRSRELADAMVDEFEAWGAERGAAEFHLVSWNAVLTRWYRRRGYGPLETVCVRRAGEGASCR